MQNTLCRIFYWPIIIVTLFLFIPSKACINFFGEMEIKNYNSALYATRNIHGIDIQYVVEDVLQQLIKDAESSGISKSNNPENIGNYAVLLLLNKEYSAAKNIFTALIKNSSDTRILYSSSANLGTIYELEGKPDSALYWINYSLRLNPQAHGGSEWIHKNILEEKIRSTLKGNNFTSNQILKLDLEKLVEVKDIHRLNQVKTQLIQQLQERIKFISPEDTIVSYMLFNLGDIQQALGEEPQAIQSYQYADEYGFPDKELIKRKLTKTSDGPFISIPMYAYVCIALIILAAAYFIYFRKKTNE